MKIKNRPMDMDGSNVERRRKHRFPVEVPVEVTWRGEEGIVVKEDAVARLANANGGFLSMDVYPEPGTRVTLANFLSAQTAEARVLAGPQTRAGVAHGIIVELVVPDEDFWGVGLMVQKASAELKTLEKALKREEAHPRLLEEFHESVKSIRMIADTVQLLRKHEIHESDDTEALSNMASERVRRAIKMCAEVMVDFDAGLLKKESRNVEELSRTIDHLHGRLRSTKR